MEIELPYKFTPRDYQCSVIRAVVDQGKRRAVCVWHRRAGKDKTFLNILVMKACETMGNYCYYFPTATLGRKALWDNIDARSGMRVVDHLPRELVAKMNEQQMKVTLVNGSTIHSPAAVLSAAEWYKTYGPRKRRGVKPMRVSATY